MSADAGPVIPPGFGAHAEAMVALGGRLEGHLTAREVRMLCLLAAVPTASGEVLEIGSFKGKSTIILAKSVGLAGGARIVAVDPLTLSAASDPVTASSDDLPAIFRANLRDHGVAEMVEFHQERSEDLARTWDRPLRFLWIDGDHSYGGAKRDFDAFAPFLAPGAVIAFHDVLHGYDGPVRVVSEDVLASDLFGACGVSGSIAWAQFLGDARAAEPHRPAKAKLRRQLSRVLRHADPRGGGERLVYRLMRALVPHGDVEPERWLRGLRAVA